MTMYLDSLDFNHHTTKTEKPKDEINKQIIFIDEINTVLDYCYQNADNSNPVQDLVDKGLVNSTHFTGKTCASVKEMSDNIPMAVLLPKQDDRTETKTIRIDE